MHITRQTLRRLNIVRQHLHAATRPPLLELVRDLGCLQLDPISTVERSHLLVLWSRLGHYDPAALDVLLWQERTLFEYWAHAASIVLTEEYPVHAWHMARAERDDDWQRYANGNDLRPLFDLVREHLRVHGGSLSREIDDAHISERFESVWWSGRYVPRVLETLWTQGEVMVVGREGKQRRWGLAESHLPSWTPRETWSDEQITRFAAQKAIRALGAATPKQIRAHYTRGRYPQLEAVLAALVAEGTLVPVQVQDPHSEPLRGDWLMHSADVPLAEALARGEAWHPRTTLLSPFDNLICDRERTEALFDFYFRIEIYVPAEKREYGYYVLPILHGDALIGRVSPRYERKTRTLHIENVYAEPSAPRNAATQRAIEDNIADLGRFLGAKAIEWHNNAQNTFKRA